MNCAPTRNHILALEDPAQLPSDLATHVAGCEECKVWHRNLIRVEKSIPLLAVPASNPAAKAALLQTIRTPQNKSPSKNHKPVPNGKGKPTPSRSKMSWSELAGQYWPTGLIAATLLVGTIAWLSLRGHKPGPGVSSPSDPMLEVVVNANLELAKARTPEQKIEALKRVADELHQEMRDICRVDPTGENMNELQEMYRDVILRGIIIQARPQILKGDAAEKKIALEKLENWLSEASQHADQLASEVPQGSVKPLREVADVARQGKKRIREYLGANS